MPLEDEEFALPEPIRDRLANTHAAMTNRMPRDFVRTGQSRKLLKKLFSRQLLSRFTIHIYVES